MIALAGCSPSRPESSGVEGPSRLVARPARQEPAFDLGAVLNVGQELSHQIEVENPRDRPLRVLRASPFAPCCSGVGPIPDSIPPGGRAGVPVTFRPGLRSGPQRVQFLVETDDPEQPQRILTLRVDLLPTLLIDELGEHPDTLLVSQPSIRRYRVTCRRADDRGRPPPESVEADGPLRAVFDGEADEQILDDGLVESTREVELTIPASGEPGHRRGSFRLRWADGSEHEVPVSWTVTEPIVASPSGLVLQSDDETTPRSILVRSVDRPFRITRISGPLLVGPIEPSDRSAAVHTLELTLDPSRATGPDPSEVRIETDHPDQPVVLLSILVLPSHQREGAQP